MNRFVGQAAAARFFPCEALIENRDVESVACQSLAAQRASRPSSDDCNVLHGRRVWPFFPVPRFLDHEVEHRPDELGAEYSIKKRAGTREPASRSNAFAPANICKLANAQDRPSLVDSVRLNRAW